MARNIDFTEGNIKLSLLKFALPLFLGNLFQQLYNTADSLIVGNFLGQTSLAAVSSSGSLVFMMISFFSGIAMGAGVVIAKAVGSKDKEKIRKAVHTDMAFGLAAGTFMTIFCSLMTPTFLRWMHTPEDIMGESVTYLRIYTLGIFFSMLYNISMGILNAVGDSRHPLYYLIFSSIVNVILDLLFILGFGMGVGSAALATVISQALSVVLCLKKLMTVKSDYRIRVRDIGFDKPTLIEIMKNGLPAGVQNSVIGFANTVVQTNINMFGSIAVASAGIYKKLEGFAFLPITSFTMALTTCIGQNMGAEKPERAKSGAKFGIFCSMLLAEIIGVLFFFFGPQLIRLFNDSPEVIALGARQSRIESLFFMLLALSHCIAAILRGAGRATVPMVVMLSVWCAFRVTYLTVMLRFINMIEIVFSCYPVTWTISSTIFVIYLIKSSWAEPLKEKAPQRGAKN